MSGSEFGIACTLSAVVYYIYDTVRLKRRLNDLRPGRSAAPHGGAHRGNALHLMAVFDSAGDFYSFTNAIRERGYRMFNIEFLDGTGRNGCPLLTNVDVRLPSDRSDRESAVAWLKSNEYVRCLERVERF